jgi:UDP-glucose 4-epimerase
MRFLITGGAGFVGSHLADALAARGDSVTVLDDLSTGCASNLAVARATGRCSLVAGDARDAALVARLVASVDHVVHMAASVGVRLFASDPVGTLTNNVRAAEVVFAAAASRGVPVLFTSSSEVYGSGTEAPFREDAPLVLPPSESPRGAYATSKLLGEGLLLAHARARGLGATIVRLFNVAGPRQRREHGMVLPRFSAQASAGEPLTIYGDGTQTRCFTHVRDVVGAIMRLLGSEPARGLVLNVGSARETSVLELARLVRGLARSDSALRFVPFAEAVGGGLDDPRHRVPDLTRLRATLGSVPETGLERIVLDALADHVGAGHKTRGGDATPEPAGFDRAGTAAVRARS